jgi:hypothetical protein
VRLWISCGYACEDHGHKVPRPAHLTRRDRVISTLIACSEPTGLRLAKTTIINRIPRRQGGPGGCQCPRSVRRAKPCPVRMTSEALGGASTGGRGLDGRTGLRERSRGLCGAPRFPSPGLSACHSASSCVNVLSEEPTTHGGTDAQSRNPQAYAPRSATAVSHA